MSLVIDEGQIVVSRQLQGVPKLQTISGGLLADRFLQCFYRPHLPSSWLPCIGEGNIDVLLGKLTCQMFCQCCLAYGYTTANENDLIVSFKQLVNFLVVVCQGEENMLLRICRVAQRWQYPTLLRTCITDFCFQSRRHSSVKSSERLEWIASSADKGQTLVYTVNEEHRQDQCASLHQLAQTLPSLGRSPHDGARLTDEVSLRLCPKQ